MAHIRQSKPDSGLGFEVKGPQTFQGVPSSLGSGNAQAQTSSLFFVTLKPRVE